eukprot:2847679-Ditylum_brightwellii.AAC.1
MGQYAACVKIPYAIRQVLIFSKKRNSRFPPHIEKERKTLFLSFLGCLDPIWSGNILPVSYVLQEWSMSIQPGQL